MNEINIQRQNNTYPVECLRVHPHNLKCHYPVQLCHPLYIKTEYLQYVSIESSSLPFLSLNIRVVSYSLPLFWSVSQAIFILAFPRVSTHFPFKAGARLCRMTKS